MKEAIFAALVASLPFLKAGGAWALLGLFGSALEAVGEVKGWPRLMKFGQRLEGASTDLPKLIRGSRFTGASVEQLAEQAAKKVDSE